MKEYNLWVIHGHYHLLKSIVKDSKSKIPKPCPVCDVRVTHEWLECLRIAQYKPLVLLDCEVLVWPPMGLEEIGRLRQNPLLWVEEDKEGKLVVKSRMPLCHFCNRVSPAHFPLECIHAQKLARIQGRLWKGTGETQLSSGAPHIKRN